LPALGWFGLGLAESAGGAGWSVPEEMVLFVEKIGPSKGVSAPISS
jgi:hypothetical protein